MSSERDAVVRRAERAIRSARAIVPAYAGPDAPVGTGEVAALLKGAGCWVEEYPFRSAAAAMALPRCAGVYPVLLNRDAGREERGFALRHELAHVLAGEVDGAVFLSDTGTRSRSERAADLFALADLVPGWWLARLGEAEPGDAALRADVARAVAAHAPAWPARRLADRAELRLRLFGGKGI